MITARLPYPANLYAVPPEIAVLVSTVATASPIFNVDRSTVKSLLISSETTMALAISAVSEPRSVVSGMLRSGSIVVVASTSFANPAKAELTRSYVGANV
ncbi:hypothetical protein D3C73_1191740 [compost metagenome]